MIVTVLILYVARAGPACTTGRRSSVRASACSIHPLDHSIPSNGVLRLVGSRSLILPVTLPKVAPSNPSPFQRAKPPPSGDAFVIAGAEHIGHPHSPEFDRPGVLRVIEEPFFAEGLLLGTVMVAEDTLLEARHGIDQDQGRQLASAQYVVAYANLERVESNPYAFVKALVVAANEQKGLLGGQPFGVLLRQPRPLRGQQNAARWLGDARPGRCFDRLHGPEDRLGLDHHSRSAAVGAIVNGSVSVGRVVPEVMQMDAKPAAFLSDLEDARVQDAREHFRKDRQHVDFQDRSPSRVIDSSGSAESFGGDRAGALA